MEVRMVEDRMAALEARVAELERCAGIRRDEVPAAPAPDAEDEALARVIADYAGGPPAADTSAAAVE
jgi:hypothetical protein